MSLGLILALVAAAVAPAIAGYKPRPTRPPKKGMTHLATRDGCDGEQLTVTLLAPADYVAEFAVPPQKTTPLTLAWSIAPAKAPAKASAKATINLKVAIYRYGKTQALVTSVPVSQSANGYWTATLDQALPIGRYAWQLSKQCGQSAKPMTELEEFDVSGMPIGVQSAINQARTPAQRSQIYAAAGFWYNALNEALLSPQPQVLAELLSDLNSNDGTK
jgi:Domain of Unknown Function (DUF928)